jgi:hypothetical protein
MVKRRTDKTMVKRKRTIEVIRIRESKGRQDNGQMKKDERGDQNP